MSADNLKIIGLLIQNRPSIINDLHAILSSYGNVIRSRLGIANPVDDKLVDALMILEVNGDETQIELMLSELTALNGIQIKHMDF
ncbi:MAG: hypothetical protein JXB17_02715 [Bacteroidales bacterium]|nr:hypothetical protein [Bacteroidales bacterium]